MRRTEYVRSYNGIVRTVHEWAAFVSQHKVELWDTNTNIIKTWVVSRREGGRLRSLGRRVCGACVRARA